MTAEICVMNSMGIALAADSAVTIGSGRKIYNSANKLFSLSKYHPIAIMIYGNAQYLRVPWETIIKVYRDKLGDKNFDTVEQFAKDFLEFLNSNSYPELISESEEDKYIYNLINEFASSAFKTILKNVKKRVNEVGDDVGEPELIALATANIDQMLFESEQNNYIDGFNEDDYRKVFEKYEDIMDQIISETFEKLIYTDALAVNLKYIIANNLIKTFSIAKSGIVIAGFGERELYPALIAYDIDGRVNGKLKYEITNQKIVGQHLTAAIVPFAQDDMVLTFVRGINPDIENTSFAYLKPIFSGLSNVIVDQLTDNLKNPDDSNAIKKNLEEVLKNIYDNYNKVLEEYKREHFSKPILNIVDSLPKGELAEMAESLVNLTSFKRRVSSSLETVGGPVDVAVVTKGDGLVWIKRKHYFKEELNQQFNQNYFRRDSYEPTTT